jgi:ribosome-binding protein aMBF1 (putative translation factor)
MTRRSLVFALAGVLAGLSVVSPAGAYTCPVLIKQAQDAIARAERATLAPEGRALLEDAKSLVAEAQRHHQTAKTKRDHDDAVRKARTAQGLAEEALKLQAR